MIVEIELPVYQSLVIVLIGDYDESDLPDGFEHIRETPGAGALCSFEATGLEYAFTCVIQIPEFSYGLLAHEAVHAMNYILGAILPPFTSFFSTLPAAAPPLRCNPRSERQSTG